MNSNNEFNFTKVENSLKKLEEPQSIYLKNIKDFLSLRNIDNNKKSEIMNQIKKLLNTNKQLINNLNESNNENLEKCIKHINDNVNPFSNFNVLSQINLKKNELNRLPIESVYKYTIIANESYYKLNEIENKNKYNSLQSTINEYNKLLTHVEFFDKFLKVLNDYAINLQQSFKDLKEKLKIKIELRLNDSINILNEANQILDDFSKNYLESNNNINKINSPNNNIISNFNIYLNLHTDNYFIPVNIQEYYNIISESNSNEILKRYSNEFEMYELLSNNLKAKIKNLFNKSATNYEEKIATYNNDTINSLNYLQYLIDLNVNNSSRTENIGLEKLTQQSNLIHSHKERLKILKTIIITYNNSYVNKNINFNDTEKKNAIKAAIEIYIQHIENTKKSLEELINQFKLICSDLNKKIKSLKKIPLNHEDYVNLQKALKEIKTLQNTYTNMINECNKTMGHLNILGFNKINDNSLNSTNTNPNLNTNHNTVQMGNTEESINSNSNRNQQITEALGGDNSPAFYNFIFEHLFIGNTINELLKIKNDKVFYHFINISKNNYTNNKSLFVINDNELILTKNKHTKDILEKIINAIKKIEKINHLPNRVKKPKSMPSNNDKLGNLGYTKKLKNLNLYQKEIYNYVIDHKDKLTKFLNSELVKAPNFK